MKVGGRNNGYLPLTISLSLSTLSQYYSHRFLIICVISPCYEPQITICEAAKASQSTELSGIIAKLQQQLEELQREKSRLDEQATLDRATIDRLRAERDDYYYQLQPQQQQPQAPPQAQMPSPPIQSSVPTPTAVEDARRVKDLSQVRSMK